MPEPPKGFIYVSSEILDILSQNPESDNESTRQYVVSMVLNYTRQLQLAEKFEPGKSLFLATDFIESEIDKFDEEAIGSITCKRGCSFCCHINVGISALEAKAIAGYCKKNKIPISKKYLKKQLSYDAREIAFSPVSACVFLKGKECSIYPVRPLSCRKYFVRSDPKFCSTEHSIVNRVEIHFNLDIEAMMSAFRNLVGLADRMPKMLLPYSK